MHVPRSGAGLSGLRCIPQGPRGGKVGEAAWEEEEADYEENHYNVFGVSFHLFRFGYNFSHRVGGSQFTKRVFGSADPGFVRGGLTAWPALGVFS